MHNEIDWSDLQYVLAVGRHGSLAAAARALCVSHTTVLRRIARFEGAHGIRLFDRLPSGYALTAGGEELLAAAQSVADMVTTLERRLAGRDLRLEGLIRVTTIDTLMVSLLPPILAGFQAEHPAVRLEVSVTTAVANLTRRDADVAIRVSADPPGTLIGRRIAPVGMAVYQAVGLETLPNEDEWPQQRWIGTSDALSETAIAHWMHKRLSGTEMVLQADSIVTMAEAAAVGVGLAPLPCYLGDAMPRLRRVSRGTIAPGTQHHLWVLTHEDLRGTARIRTFTAYVSEALILERHRIEGGADALRNCPSQ
ncbi:LysR family transcriptional regulator [Sphingosinicella rhizophila]|uniref:LysR family transcriptional regulator n=1 Tax=Sphingosinicella rhizophila TaxID=3050082 RepID=A0ABU3Q4Z0_9SPHN|nr:LysR family transcriptional regulator [Sphingosinicella sp. GR2756]MDT9598477.1 LysR family transcriptional regulator [Sphingosinicella sp. GR2756]